VPLGQRLVEAVGRRLPQRAAPHGHQRQRPIGERGVGPQLGHVPLPGGRAEELLVRVDEVGRGRPRDVRHGLDEVGFLDHVVGVQADDPVASRAPHAVVARVGHAAVGRAQHLVAEACKVCVGPAPPVAQLLRLPPPSVCQLGRGEQPARVEAALLLGAVVDHEHLRRRVGLPEDAGQGLLDVGHVAEAGHHHADVARRRPVLLQLGWLPWHVWRRAAEPAERLRCAADGGVHGSGAGLMVKVRRRRPLLRHRQRDRAGQHEELRHDHQGEHTDGGGGERTKQPAPRGDGARAPHEDRVAGRRGGRRGRGRRRVLPFLRLTHGVSGVAERGDKPR